MGRVILFFSLCLTANVLFAQQTQATCEIQWPEDVVFSAQEKCQIEKIAARCGEDDGCYLDCLVNRKGDGVGGGCWHICGNQLKKIEENWTEENLKDAEKPLFEEIKWEVPERWGECAVTFLSDELAEDTIVNDSLMPYFELMQPAEMVAKTGGKPLTATTLKDQQEETRQRYRQAVTTFSMDEQKTLMWLVKQARKPLAATFPLLDLEPWVFLKVKPNIEGGLPHTRDKAIVLSTPVVAGLMAEQKQAEAKGSLPFRGIMLMIHEQVHVFQRKNPGYFDDFYASMWGFEKVDLPPLPAPLDRMQLLNPDAVICDWVFSVGEGDERRTYLPLVSFSPEAGNPKMPSDMISLAVAVKKHNGEWKFQKDPKGEVQSVPLSSLQAYSSRFVPNASIYHPEEIMADSLAWLVLTDQLLDPARLPEDMAKQLKVGLDDLRTWLESKK